MEKIGGYCVDSDILIDYLRGFSDARNFFLSGAVSVLYISIVSVVEVYSGKETREPEKTEALRQFLQNFSIIELNPAIARLAGELRRDHRRPFADMIVAASALAYGLPLITRNVKHYKGIKGLEVRSPY